MNSTKFTITLLISCLVLILVLNIGLSIMNENINKKLDILEAQIQETQTHIKDIRAQIDSYEMGYNKSQDTASKQPNDIKTLSYQPTSVEPDTHTDSDIFLLAQLIESESGNQSFNGKLAVGTVVMNRVASDGFPDTIKEVIFQKRQFSVVSNGRIDNEPSDESLKAARSILNGMRVLDSDVLYFYNPKLINKKNWITSRKIDKVIGDHAFAI